MSPEVLDWVGTAHLFGAILWISGLVASIYLLRATAAGGGSAAADTARQAALLMDIGAALAIAGGLVMALGTTPTLMKEGWLHIKLTVIAVGLLALHGIARAKIGKARRGEQTRVPGFLLPVAIALPAVIVALAVTKPI